MATRKRPKRKKHQGSSSSVPRRYSVTFQDGSGNWRTLHTHASSAHAAIQAARARYKGDPGGITNVGEHSSSQLVA